MKRALVIGAGPAGLTAALELLTQMPDVDVTVLEETGDIGGISKNRLLSRKPDGHGRSPFFLQNA